MVKLTLRKGMCCVNVGHVPGASEKLKDGNLDLNLLITKLVESENVLGVPGSVKAVGSFWSFEFIDCKVASLASNEVSTAGAVVETLLVFTLLNVELL